MLTELATAAQEMLDSHTTPKPRFEDCMADEEVRADRHRDEVKRWGDRRRQSRARLRRALLDHESALRAKGGT